MGWMHCGEDSNGRPIGYGEPAVCDYPGCTEPIDRGLAHACGGMHGANDGCEKYFCQDHLHYLSTERSGWFGSQVCADCLDAFVLENGTLCPECDGDGKYGWGGREVCQSCNGTGHASSGW